MPHNNRRSAEKSRLIVGLMSGTSVDGIDAALVQIRGTAPRLAARVLCHHEHPWPKKLRQRILAVMAPATTTTAEICQLQVLIADQFAEAALACLRTARVSPSNITALASHGQTVCHLPPTHSKRQSSTPSTLQLGDPSVIAAKTGILTVGNFRPADMAAGGQGAPLVPFADAMLLTHPTRPRCVQNIGGIANVTYLPGSRTGGGPVLAFDTGPGNMLLDAVVSLATRQRKRFDADGRLAARGTLDYTLFRQLQAHPYFTQRPPKSTGRELFGVQMARQLYTRRVEKGRSNLEDLVATLTHLTAWSIADAYIHFIPELPEEVILCGGGADNPTLVKMLRDYLDTLHPPRPIRLSRIDQHGIPNKSKEAASFALLAAATLDGVPANVPSVTGASRPALLGVIAPRL